MKLSRRVAAMEQSPIRKFNVLAIDAEKKGKKIYRLNIGQPDIETPECFMETIRNYDDKVIAYSESGGEVVLQKAIANYFKRFDMEYAPDQIMVTNGGSEALSMVFTAILDPDSEVLVAEPFYSNYHTFISSACGKVKPILTKAEEGYNFVKRDLIEAAITPQTRAICCTTPGNPTGRVMTLEEMKLIGEIAIKHDLWIIADEVYREFVYDNREAASFGMLKQLEDRVIIIDSISKRFSACGARIGCIVSKNEELMDGIMKLAQGRLCSPTLDQIGAAALYNLGDDYYAEVKAEYEGRRDVVYEELMKIPGVVCQKPGGAFYVMAKLPVDNVEDFLVYMLTEFEDNGETVMFSPAEGFYGTEGIGRDEIRIAYVLNKEDLRRGAELIRLGIEKYSNR